MKQSQRRIKVGFVLLSLLLGACASKPPQLMLPVKSEVPQPIRFKASFDCTQSASTLQDVVCADDTLATLDRDMADAYHANLRSLDLVGRMQLIADQRHWLLGRAPQCRLPKTRLGAATPDPKRVSCLDANYRRRIVELKAWPQPQARKVTSAIGADKSHPLTAYVEFRLVDGHDAALCASFAKQFNEAIGERGEADFSHMNGFAEIAGSHGSANGSADGHRYSVGLYDAGPYASYQRRATSLDIDGQTAIHDRSIGEWAAQLSNSGGRFGDTSSQTRDYAAIDLFRTMYNNAQRTFALVTEAWGYYSAAALGESDYAGVYDLSGSSAQPLCLYSTYLVPPIARAFDKLPAYTALNQTLSQMTGEPPQLEMDERRDEGLLQKETEWNLLNMPLVAIGEIERFGREAALRQRHDAALDAIWSWSERNVPSKLFYRRLLPMVQPAYDELVVSFQHMQGLKPEEAKIAAGLMIMDLIDRAAENLSDFNNTKTAPLPPFAQYTPRYAPAPMPGDLERGRKLVNLHSAALNRAPADAIGDFIKYEAAAPMRSVGAAGDTALMAAVRSPETVKQLLDAGFAVNATNDWRKTALMTAAQTDQFASVQILLDAGADPRRTTSCWHQNGAGALDNAEGAVAKRSALMYAAAGGGEPLLRLLLDHGAEVVQRDAAGRSACDYLADNKLLTDAERAAIKNLLCTKDSMPLAQANPVPPCPAGAMRSVSEEEAKELGGPVLTLFGAEKAGNDEGTIPEYSGASVKAPPGWNPDNPGVRPDPYDEKPLFSITAQNAAQYADRLDAMIEVFRKYPNFRMDIYPSHRDFVFPQYVLDNTVKNSTACKVKDNELKLEGCYGGLPFPIPETGKQAMWNHLIAYKSRASSGISAQYVVPASGAPFLASMAKITQDFPFYDPAASGPRTSSAIFWRGLSVAEAPERTAGYRLLMLNSLDQLGLGNRLFMYVPGQSGAGMRKLQLTLTYDTLWPSSGGTHTVDDLNVFNGAMDHYDFKLIGKKEKFIFYNGFKMTDPKVCSAAMVLTKNFPNPDCMRWELHRVWVVEATLRPGFHHTYPKRVFFWDEDGYIAGQAENYAADGRLYRVVIGTSYPYFEAPGGNNAAIISLDLKTGTWSAQGIACADCGDRPLSGKVDDSVFSPEAMATAGIR